MTGNMWLLTCSIFNFIVLKIRVAELLKQNYDENSRLSVMAVTMWTYSCRETCFILNVFWNYNALRTGVDKHLELPHQVSPTLATLLFLSQLKKKKKLKLLCHLSTPPHVNCLCTFVITSTTSLSHRLFTGAETGYTTLALSNIRVVCSKKQTNCGGQRRLKDI